METYFTVDDVTHTDCFGCSKKLQEQKRENAKQRKVIEDLAIWTKQKEKDAAMTLHKETLKTGGSTKTKKKKASKKKEVEPTSEDEVEVDDLESCKIIKKKKASTKKKL